jgi:uncharacterized protein YdhG (YjbR/CyaY superfamily)
MARTAVKPVAAYIASQPASARRALTRVRSAIRQALPDAEEVLSYKIPAYRLHGRVVIYFAGWKDHYSIYPATARLAAAFTDALAPYELSHKGTIRFPFTGTVPVRLIERLAKFRAKEVVEGRKAKGGRAKA